MATTDNPSKRALASGNLRPRFVGAEPGSATEQLTEEQALEIWEHLQHNRMVEERLALLYRTGKVVGGLYRSLGQEAISVGTAYALEERDWVGPLIRNLGTMLVRGVRPREAFTQYLARATSPTGGRDGNTHFGDLERRIIAPISHLGAVIPVMAGIGLAARMRGEDCVAMTYIGDGGTSTGDFHEGMNMAAVFGVPHADFGEAVVAAIVPDAESSPDEAALIDDLRTRLANFKVPKRVIELPDLPRNTMGKVQKNLLREQYGALFES